MTDIPDLISEPQVRWAYLLQEYMEDLREKQRKDERAIDRMVEECRTRLHRLNLKTESTMKRIFDELLVRANHNEGAEAAAWFEFILKTKRQDLVMDVLERAAPVIRDIERNGGQLEVDIRRTGHGSGGCIYSDRRHGYFSFCSEFLDGFDDDIVYVIKKETKTRAQQDKERDARIEAHLEEWRAKEKAKRAENIEEILRDGLGGQLREVDADDAAADCG